jgi:hypothetical protein
MLSFCLGSLFGRGQTRALVDSAPPTPRSRATARAARLPAIAGPRRHHPPTAPIDDRDRVESGSPLPRRLSVAIP